MRQCGLEKSEVAFLNAMLASSKAELASESHLT